MSPSFRMTSPEGPRSSHGLDPPGVPGRLCRSPVADLFGSPARSQDSQFERTRPLPQSRMEHGQADKTEWMHRLAALLKTSPHVEILHLHFAEWSTPAA
jgi:hypothetical protein